jgi:hypothetical protein
VNERAGDQQRSYRDLRERTKRREHWRDYQLERIIGLQRERHLHSFESTGAPARVAVLWPAPGGRGWRIQGRIAA